MRGSIGVTMYQPENKVTQRVLCMCVCVICHCSCIDECATKLMPSNRICICNCSKMLIVVVIEIRLCFEFIHM